MNYEDSRQSNPNETNEDEGRGGPSEGFAAKLDPFAPFVKRTASVNFDRQDIFTACLVSSFVKSFEFLRLTSLSGGDGTLFLTASLRSVVEEIILLNFLSNLCHDKREYALIRLMELEVRQNAKHQNAFFRTFRPFQPVIPVSSNDDKRIQKELAVFWRQNGWPRFQPGNLTATPPTIEIAAKSKPGFLEVVYDFIYRLSSNSVHFRPGALLRLGWGADKTHMTFGPKHLSSYFLGMCQVYGCYLFCLYFELFSKFLELNPDENEALVELRRHLLWMVRWPEMVTFEEMNVPAPSGLTLVNALLHGSYVRIMEGGFIAGTIELLRLEQEGLPLWPTHRMADS